MSKRILEWLMCFNAAATVVTLVGADALHIQKLFDAGMCFAGSTVIFYMFSRIATR